VPILASFIVGFLLLWSMCFYNVVFFAGFCTSFNKFCSKTAIHSNYHTTGWRLSSRTWNPITSPRIKQKTWLMILLIEQCLTSQSTQYRLYGRQFLQVKRPNQQYQSTEGKSTKDKPNNGNNTKHICIDIRQ